MLVDQTIKLIRENQFKADWAFNKVLQNLLETFHRIEDPYLRERANDVRQIGHRVLENLAGNPVDSIASIKESSGSRLRGTALRAGATGTAILVSGYFLRKGQYGWSFTMTCISIAGSIITLFTILFPRVMISSLGPAWSLTIYTAASSPYTLQVMTVIALIFVPIVLAYQAWTYWVFRKRLEARPESLTY